MGQAEKQSCMEYQKRAVERIAAFERAFGGQVGRKWTGEARFSRNGTGNLRMYNMVKEDFFDLVEKLMQSF